MYKWFYTQCMYIITSGYMHVCSDDDAVSKMMPKNRQKDMGFYTQIVTVSTVYLC